MIEEHRLPFKVGQMAEARSFLHGYRGAWFRCKIKQIRPREGCLSYLLEYYDFPDEKEKWTRVYQKSSSRLKFAPKILMVRPEYPSLYHPSQLPAFGSMPEVIVVADGTWRVGDFVDWRKDDCYWSGKVIRIIGRGKAEIEFPAPPMGEGKSYEVPIEDLRPSLEWSPENGWRLPRSTDDGSSSQSARLIQQANQVNVVPLAQKMPTLSEKYSNDQTAYGSSSSPNDAMTSPTPSVKLASVKPDVKKESFDQANTLEPEITSALERNCNAEAVLPEINSGPQLGDGIADFAAQTSEKDADGSDFIRKRFRNNGSVPLNSMRSNTLGAAIVDLEELAHKIRWLKGILKATDATSNSTRPIWKFTENRA